MGGGTCRRLDEFLNDMRRCGAIRVTHRHVNDIFTTMARRHFELSRNIKDIRWQTLNPGKPLHRASLFVGLGKNRAAITKQS